MATTTSSRSRRDTAQLRALARIEPDLKACDQTWRRKYLQEYTQAFRSYERVIDRSEFETQIASASLILVGDYHALPACQQFTAKLLQDCARNGPVVLALEAIFSRDQHILDEWCRHEICEQELRQRIRYDLDWGYDWDPFYELLSAARKHAKSVFALDCMPREDLRKIGIRDRHAAHKLAEVRKRYPGATIVVFIGESHLAPTHLPTLIAKELPGENVLSILQNVDPLYWGVSQEQQDAQVVRVSERTLCVFNSTPLEKYESYRRCLDRWRSEQDLSTDFAPAIYDLIDQLLRFLDVNRHSTRNGTQPKFLIDLFPEIYGLSTNQLRQLLVRHSIGPKESETIVERLNARDCTYIPRFNSFVVRKFNSSAVAEEAARFVHHACQNLYLYREGVPSISPGDRFHIERVEDALVYLGSQALHRLKHKSDPGDQLSPAKSSSLGGCLYGAHLKGNLSRADLKRLFLFPIRESGKAAELCAHLERRLGFSSE